MIYALDTNVISFFIQGNEAIKTNIRAELNKQADIIIPPVAYYEIRRGFKYKSAPAKERVFTNMCFQFPVGEMNIETWEQAADIYSECRKQGRTIEDTDILIAAFCIVHGYTLVTHNTKHFQGIDGLTFVDWYE